MKRPGLWLRRQCAHVCSDQTMARLVDPVVADLQKEHADALAAGRRWSARLIHARGCGSLACALAIQGVGRSQWNTAVRLSVACVLLISLVFIARNMSAVAWSHASDQRLILLLAPAALAAAFPVGFMVMLLYGLRQRPASRPVAVCVLATALVSAAGSALALGWIVPASNQAFREEAAGSPVGRGANELTLIELRAMVEGRQSSSSLVAPAQGNDISLAYYARIAFASAPIWLAGFALAVASRSRTTRMVAGAIVVASYFAYMFTLDAEAGRRWAAAVTPVVAAWLPNAAIVLVSLMIAVAGRLKPAPTTAH